MKERSRRLSAFIVSSFFIWLLKQGCAFFNSASFANCDVNIVVNSGK